MRLVVFGGGVMAAALLVLASPVPDSPDTPPGASLGRAMTPHERADANRVGDMATGDQRAAYLEALQSVGRGEDGAALRVAEMQRQVFEADSLRGLDRLQRKELEIATLVAARDPIGARPVVWLHYRAAAAFRGRRDSALRGPATNLTVAMAAMLRRLADTEEDRDFAIEVMVCSAYGVLDDGMREQAVDLFGRVLRIEPANRPAMLGAGAVYERLGDFPHAVRQLRELEKAYPSDGEGRLRLAVNLARVGADDEAEALFRAVAADAEEGWVRIVAVEQLATLLMARRDLVSATEILREAVAAEPRSSRLKIQLAAALDRMGRPSEASRIVDDVRQRGADPSMSPRWRYAVWPAFDREEHERRLAEVADEGTAALAAAIGSLTEGTAS
jgi:Flp pilus assembly protein TadD